MSNVKFDFTGENFVVTGASSGMGRQVALELAQSGAKVLGIARREDRLRELQAQFPSNVFVASLDVCNSEQMECAIQEFVAINGKLHGGVHAAGINNFTPLKAYDKNLAHNIMDISFWAGVELVVFLSNIGFSLSNAKCRMQNAELRSRLCRQFQFVRPSRSQSFCILHFTFCIA